MTSIYEHFGSQTVLPVKLKEVHDFILQTGVVSKIERYSCDTENALVGLFHKYYDLAPPYQERPIIVRIGYSSSASEGAQRLVQVKEMLHALDSQEATSPTKACVEKLVNDLLLEAAEKEIGLPAQVDHLTFLNALCVLMPIAAIDIIRPQYKAGKITVAQVAAEARLPIPYVTVTLSDEWRRFVEHKR